MASAFDEIFLIECPACNEGRSSVRVTGGDLMVNGSSSYACSDCVGVKEAVMRRHYDDVAIVPLPNRGAA